MRESCSPSPIPISTAHATNRPAAMRLLLSCASISSGSWTARLPVICADGKRYAIVAAIDIWSRQARVLVVPTSRATAIATLLRCCILEWGMPEAVRTDEGKDYTSRHVLGVLADLEVEHRPCPPYTPEAKPFVERFLGTLTRDLFATLPGLHRA